MNGMIRCKDNEANIGAAIADSIYSGETLTVAMSFFAVIIALKSVIYVLSY